MDSRLVELVQELSIMRKAAVRNIVVCLLQAVVLLTVTCMMLTVPQSHWLAYVIIAAVVWFFNATCDATEKVIDYCWWLHEEIQKEKELRKLKGRKS